MKHRDWGEPFVRFWFIELLSRIFTWLYMLEFKWKTRRL